MNDTYLKSKKILIVDDEECLRSMLITILEDENFLNIITADCVKTALEICQQEKPDIAILDVMLPEKTEKVYLHLRLLHIWRT